RLARTEHLNPKRKFRKGSSRLYGTGARSDCRSYLSLRPNVRIFGRRAQKIFFVQFYKLADRPCFPYSSSATNREDDGFAKCGDPATNDRTRDRNNRTEPFEAYGRRTPTHSSLRRKTNSQSSAGTSNTDGKIMGDLEEEHRRISWHHRLFAQPHLGA